MQGRGKDMNCPNCNHGTTKVLDSRPIEKERTIRRRRICDMCGYRFTTFERIETRTIFVRKTTGELVPFDKEKIVTSIAKSAAKRLPLSLIREISDKIYQKILLLEKPEINSKEIGQEILQELKKIDEVAFIRYASIFYNFENIESFMAMIEEVKREEE